MDNVFIGVIREIFDAKGGTTKKGDNWKVQSFLIEEEKEQYPKKLVFDVFGKEKIEKMNIRKGGKYAIHLDLDAHEYQGRWYNQVRAWKVEFADAYLANKKAEAQLSEQEQSDSNSNVENLKDAFDAETVDVGSDTESPDIPF